MPIDADAIKAAGDALQLALRESGKANVQGAAFIHNSITSCLLKQTVYPSRSAAVSRVEPVLTDVKAYLASIDASITL
jgi:hypothetical protein